MNAADPFLATLPGTEGQLLEAARRALRQPSEAVALVLRLSGLRPPAPLPHHLRIVRALLHDAAQQLQGQVFALRNGDMVLLCRLSSDQGEGARAAERLLGVTATLARLVREEAADPEAVITIWPLRTDLRHLLEYASARAVEGLASAPPPGEDADLPLAVEAIAEAARSWSVAAPGEMLRLQTAIRLAPADGSGRGIVPLFTEIAVAVGALERRCRRRGQAVADPALFHHLAGRLDALVLDVLHGALGGGSPLDLAASGLPVHLNLTLAGLGTAAFAALAGAARRTLAVELSLGKSCAEPERLAEAQAALARQGIVLVLDRVGHQALLLARPWALGAALLKLDWSPRLAELPPREAGALDAALAEAGAERLILHRADTEAALRWGLARGITRFQGRHVDAMLAARRMSACPYAGACTLRLCAGRAAAATRPGHAGCFAPERLEAAA